MATVAPTIARVASLTQWTRCFHPTEGAFRLPSSEGKTIEHLDLDLRFVQHEFEVPKEAHGLAQPLYLPHVCVLVLRGAEHVLDNEEMMECLSEVLLAVNPIEVKW